MENKSGVIKKYVDRGLITMPALNKLYEMLPADMYGIMDWFVHSLVWLKGAGNGGPREDLDDRGWDMRVLKKEPVDKLTKYDLEGDSMILYAIDEFASMASQFRKNPDLFSTKDLTKIPVWDLVKQLERVGHVISKRKLKRKKKQQSEKVFEDDGVLVIAPQSAGAACFYGKGTRWCTSASTNNKFDEYSGKGTLYYVFDKLKNIKWAIFVHDNGMKEAFDAKDHPISPLDIIKRYEIEKYIK